MIRRMCMLCSSYDVSKLRGLTKELYRSIETDLFADIYRDSSRSALPQEHIRMYLYRAFINLSNIYRDVKCLLKHLVGTSTSVCIEDTMWREVSL